MRYNWLTLDNADEITTVFLNRTAKLNAINEAMLGELNDALSYIERNINVKAAIITGSGGNFSSGMDLSVVASANEPFLRYRLSCEFHNLVIKITQLEKPVIAAIQGYALGGGLELAMACDFRIAAEDARMGFPEINHGGIPAGSGTVKLQHLIGVAKAKELLMFGDIISGKHAEVIGLVSKAVPADQVLSEAESWAVRLAKKSPRGLQAIKTTIRISADSAIAAAMEVEAYGFAMLSPGITGS